MGFIGETIKGKLEYTGVIVTAGVLGYVGFFGTPQVTGTADKAAAYEHHVGVKLYKAGQDLDTVFTAQGLPLIDSKADADKNKGLLEKGKDLTRKAIDLTDKLSPGLKEKIPGVGYIEEQKRLVNEYKPIHTRLQQERAVGGTLGFGLGIGLWAGGRALYRTRKKKE